MHSGITESPLVYTISDAASLLQVSPGTIRRWIAEEFIQVIRLGKGRIIRIPAGEVQRLIGSRRSTRTRERQRKGR